MDTKVVFHIDWEVEDRLIMALNNIKNLLVEVPAEKTSVSMVVNGGAVKLFRQDRNNDYSDTVIDLVKQGVNFCMCNNSLNKFEIDHGNIIQGCKIIKAGVLELIHLQNDGYAYIKP